VNETRAATEPPIGDTVPIHTVLAQAEWQAAQQHHQAIVDVWAAPRLARRQRGERHPVDDFLWEYYPVRPAQLRRWSPGVGVALAGASDEFLAQPGFVATPQGAAVDPHALPHQLKMATQIASLLAATASRQGRFGCFALHEWAMVYGQPQEEVRHRAWPLRLEPNAVKAVVDEVGLRCTHFDAFRFYTDASRPLNPLQLTRETQIDNEQPGCLHANMDLFKWAWQLFPLTSSDLVRATREFAVQVRQLDMQAAPYDLRSLGVEPIEVETADGRARFAAQQKVFADHAAQLRDNVLGTATDVLRYQPASQSRDQVVFGVEEVLHEREHPGGRRPDA
jgi:hypothetical protein